VEELKQIRDIAPLLTYLQDEDSLTIAVIVSHLNPTQATELLEGLSKEKVIEIAIDMANLDKNNQAMVDKIQNHLVRKMNGLK
jgi:flagellar motor switch protein FliG